MGYNCNLAPVAIQLHAHTHASNCAYNDKRLIVNDMLQRSIFTEAVLKVQNLTQLLQGTHTWWYQIQNQNLRTEMSLMTEPEPAYCNTKRVIPSTLSYEMIVE